MYDICMKMIVGLGNPGKKYEHTRHNVGFDTIDLFAESLGVSIDKEGFKSLYVRVKYIGHDLILLKPQTFMNLSGEAVLDCAHYFKIDPCDIFVIYDDMDFEPGIMKIKESGSSGGHNGIKSIINCLGTDQFIHVRIGTGKPQFDTIDYVLGKPLKEERLLIKKAENKAVEAIKVAIKEGVPKAMSIYNKQEKDIDWFKRNCN